MLPDDTRRKIENITSGTLIEGKSDHCTAIRNSLCRSFATSTTVKTDFEDNAVIKEKQARLLESYCIEHQLWLTNLPPEDSYLTRGGESEVYLHYDNRHVIKLNDGVYYATWLEFLNSILLHNLLFTSTAYTLMGFAKEEETLMAILKQSFIISDAHADLSDVKQLLAFNGFENTRRNDYINSRMGLILEDLHDENVIVNSETLFFIDTVFYTVTPVHN
jgi:hypothetical protein